MEIEPRFLNARTAYVSSIPAESEEKKADYPWDKNYEKRVYFLNNEKVGERLFTLSGELEVENGMRGEVRQGWTYHWGDPGQLSSAEFYENGLAHGTAYQWAEDGRFIGTYTLEHGTGLDVWRELLPDGRVGLAEARYYQNGLPHGWEWWFHAGTGAAWQETRWFEGQRHGIEREWNDEKLSRDSPRYWICDEKVTRAKYICACAKDPTLPPFRIEDNARRREFPPEIAPHLIHAAQEDK